MDTLAVTIPAAPQYVQVVRLIAAGLGSRLGFTIDDIEDLKIAVDELAAYLTGPSGRDGTLQIEFHVHDDRVEITGAGHLRGDQAVKDKLTEFSRQILETVADESSLDRRDGIPTFRLVKKKGS